MSASSSPIQAQPLTLNKTFTIDNRKELIKNTAIYALLKTASVVAYLATIAIAATVLAFTFLATGGTTMPFFMIGVALLSIPLCWGASKMWHMADPYKLKADEARGKIEAHKLMIDIFKKENNEPIDANNSQAALKVKQIVELDCDKIRSELRAYNIDHNLVTLQEIARNLPRKKDEAPATEEDAIKSFVPVLACMSTWMETFHASYDRSQSLHNTRNINPKKNTLSTRLEHHRIGHDVLERSVLSSALKAAHALHILRNPFAKSSNISDLGTTQIMPIDARLWGENDYFVFHDNNRIPIPFINLRQAADQLHSHHVAYKEAEKNADVDRQVLTAHLEGQVQQLQILENFLFVPRLKAEAVSQKVSSEPNDEKSTV